MILSSILFVVGSALLLALGAIHLRLTLLDERRPRVFAPRDPELLASMQASPLRIDKSTTVWRASLGFHYSHSLGLIWVGLLFGSFGIFAWRTLLELPVLLWSAPVIALVYLVLSLRYWFKIPAIGAGLAVVLLTLGAVLSA